MSAIVMLAVIAAVFVFVLWRQYQNYCRSSSWNLSEVLRQRPEPEDENRDIQPLFEKETQPRGSTEIQTLLDQ